MDEYYDTFISYEWDLKYSTEKAMSYFDFPEENCFENDQESIICMYRLSFLSFQSLVQDYLRKLSIDDKIINYCLICKRKKKQENENFGSGEFKNETLYSDETLFITIGTIVIVNVAHAQKLSNIFQQHPNFFLNFLKEILRLCSRNCIFNNEKNIWIVKLRKENPEFIYELKMILNVILKLKNLIKDNESNKDELYIAINEFEAVLNKNQNIDEERRIFEKILDCIPERSEEAQRKRIKLERQKSNELETDLNDLNRSGDVHAYIYFSEGIIKFDNKICDVFTAILKDDIKKSTKNFDEWGRQLTSLAKLEKLEKEPNQEIVFNLYYFNAKFCCTIIKEIENKPLVKSFNNYLRVLLIFYDYSIEFKKIRNENLVSTILKLLKHLAEKALINNSYKNTIELSFALLYKHSRLAYESIYESFNSETIISDYLNKELLNEDMWRARQFAVMYLAIITSNKCFAKLNEKFFKDTCILTSSALNMLRKDELKINSMDSKCDKSFICASNGSNQTLTNLYAYEMMEFMLEAAKVNGVFKQRMIDANLYEDFLKIFNSGNIYEKMLISKILLEISNDQILTKLKTNKIFGELMQFKFDEQANKKTISEIRNKYDAFVSRQKDAEKYVKIAALHKMNDSEIVLYLNADYTEDDLVFICTEMFKYFNGPIAENSRILSHLIKFISDRHEFYEVLVPLLLKNRFYEFINQFMEDYIDVRIIESMSDAFYELLHHLMRMLVLYSENSEEFQIRLFERYNFKLKLSIVLSEGNFLNDERVANPKFFFLVNSMITILYNASKNAIVIAFFRQNSFYDNLIFNLKRYSEFKCDGAALVVIAKLLNSRDILNTKSFDMNRCYAFLNAYMAKLKRTIKQNNRDIFRNLECLLSVKPFETYCSIEFLLQSLNSLAQYSLFNNELANMSDFFESIFIIYCNEMNDQEKIAACNFLEVLDSNITAQVRLFSNKKLMELLRDDSIKSNNKTLKNVAKNVLSNLHKRIKISEDSSINIQGDIKVSVEASD